MTSDAGKVVRPVRLGVVALGRAFVLSLPALRNSDYVELVAACDLREQALDAFRLEFDANCFTDLDKFLADPEIEAVYIASPHQLHFKQAMATARAGKHLLLEKPMALELEHAKIMTDAFNQRGLQFIIGPSHSFDPPVQLARKIIDSGELGQPRLIQAFNYTDFLYRPRRPEELRTEEGGGVIYSQAIHQVDTVRLLAGGKAESVYALTGDWDPSRPSEGAYSTLIKFENNIIATLTYSGYAHFDSDEWMGWNSELGVQKQVEDYGSARRLLREVDSAEAEISLKNTRGFGSGAETQVSTSHEHFGPIIVACDRGDLRLTPDGVTIYNDCEKQHVLADKIPSARDNVLAALYNSIRNDEAPVQTGDWGLASLEVCLAMLESASTKQSIPLHNQISLKGI